MIKIRMNQYRNDKNHYDNKHNFAYVERMENLSAENLRDLLVSYIEESGESLNSIAKSLGIQQASLQRYIQGKQQSISYDASVRLLVMLGYSIKKESPLKDAAKDVCFVNAKLAPVASDQLPPQEEDYMAVPLVEEVGAGPGMIPQGELLSWFLVYKHQDAVRYRSNLVAVQIGKDSTSMTPLLHPGDVVLVDLDDKDTRKPGRIMLVMDPDGSGMIKRVAVEQQPNDYRLTFYSDNAAENPPSVYSWREHFQKDWGKAIAGHVVWSWSDISGK